MVRFDFRSLHWSTGPINTAQVIDGYYRVRAERAAETVSIAWVKVQSLNGALLRLLTGKDQYQSVNEESANSTADLLVEYVEHGANAKSA